MHGRRGVDSWESVKWLPRFLVFAMSLVLILYIFAVAISVDYDPVGLKADTTIAQFLYSDVFTSPHDRSAIALERFTDSSIEQAYPSMDSEEADPDSDRPIIDVLVFAPISARFVLTSLDGSFDTREVYYERDTFMRLRELYIGRERSSIAFARAHNIVRVINESEPERIMPARLTIEVIV